MASSRSSEDDADKASSLDEFASGDSSDEGSGEGTDSSWENDFDEDGAAHDGDYFEGDDGSDVDDDVVVELRTTSQLQRIERSAGSPLKTAGGSVVVVRNTKELFAFTEVQTGEITDALGVSLQQSRQLLAVFGCDAERVREEYGADPERAYAKAGIETRAFRGDVGADEAKSGAGDEDDDLFECGVCLLDFENVADETIAMDSCGHRFCNTCWTGHVAAAVSEKQKLLTLCCLSAECTECVAAPAMELFGAAAATALGETEAKLRARYEEWVCADWVQRARFLAWCRNPRCDLTLHYTLSERQILSNPSETGEVSCLCATRMCWLCKDEGHTPCTCGDVKEWRELGSSENAEQRLRARCKQCPQCGHGAYIDDKKYCNHITCVCGHDWCWMCGAPWREHGGNFYACNRWQAGGVKSKKAGERRREVDLGNEQRYMFYLDRFTQHAAASSGRAADALLSAVANSAQLLTDEKGLTRQQLKFLSDATECVKRARNALKWSYAYLYFMAEDDTDAERNLFINHQGQLEQVRVHLFWSFAFLLFVLSARSSIPTRCTTCSSPKRSS